MAITPRVQRVGQEHCVIYRSEIDAVVLQDQKIIFDVLTNFAHGRRFQHRLQRRQRLFQGNLVWGAVTKVEPFARAMLQRHVTSFAGFSR